MPDLPASRTLAVSIERAPQEVYDYIVDPRHLPDWVPSFAQSVRQEGEDWIVDTAGGPARIDFVPRNPWLVADHHVYLGDGTTVLNPLRVIPNGEGSEVVFTLIREASQSAAEFDELAGVVQDDLDRLRSVLAG